MIMEVIELSEKGKRTADIEARIASLKKEAEQMEATRIAFEKKLNEAKAEYAEMIPVLQKKIADIDTKIIELQHEKTGYLDTLRGLGLRVKVKGGVIGKREGGLAAKMYELMQGVGVGGQITNKDIQEHLNSVSGYVGMSPREAVKTMAKLLKRAEQVEDVKSQWLRRAENAETERDNLREQVRGLVNVISAAAPLSWAAGGDEAAANAWEIKAIEALDAARGEKEGMMTLRQCEVFASTKQYPEEFLGCAFFHGFMQDHKEYDSGPGSIPVALIEWVSSVNAVGTNPAHTGGTVVTVDPGQIRFLYNPTM